MRIAKILALAVAGGIFLLPTPYPADEQPTVEKDASSDSSLGPLYSLPFSVAHVLAYFTEAFGERPSRLDARSFVYIDRDNPDEVVIITVSQLQASLGVVLFATGDYGVKYIREFFEAPFFLRRETEQLYRLLDGGPGIRSVTLERFNIQMGITVAEGWIVVAIEFSPLQLYWPHLALMTSRRAGSSEQSQFSNSQAAPWEATFRILNQSIAPRAPPTRMAVSVLPQLVSTIVNFQSMPTKSKFLAKSGAAKPSAELN